MEDGTASDSGETGGSDLPLRDMPEKIPAVSLPGAPVPFGFTLRGVPMNQGARFYDAALDVPPGWRAVWRDAVVCLIVLDLPEPPPEEAPAAEPEVADGMNHAADDKAGLSETPMPLTDDEPFLKPQGPAARRRPGDLRRAYMDAVDRPADGPESKALDILLTATKAALSVLVDGITKGNASRTLAQVGHVTEAQRGALQILGAHVNPEDLGRNHRRQSKYGAGGLGGHMDRETMGISAMGQMVAAWQAAEKPKSVAALLAAAASAKAIGDEALSKDLATQATKLSEEIKHGPTIDSVGKDAMSAMRYAADLAEGGIHQGVLVGDGDDEAPYGDGTLAVMSSFA